MRIRGQNLVASLAFSLFAHGLVFGLLALVIMPVPPADPPKPGLHAKDTPFPAKLLPYRSEEFRSASPLRPVLSSRDQLISSFARAPQPLSQKSGDNGASGVAKENLQRRAEVQAQAPAPILNPAIYQILPSPDDDTWSDRNRTVKVDRRIYRDPAIDSAIGQAAASAGGGSQSADSDSIALGLKSVRPRLNIPGLEGYEDAATLDGSSPLALPYLNQESKGLFLLDDMLVVSSTYWTDLAAQKRYFRLDISVNQQAGKLPAVAKDVVFLVDCSGSISADMLEQFRRGISKALEALGPEDRFNVVAFNTKSRQAFAVPAKPAAASLAEARKFLATLTSAGKTDVYEGLAPFITSAKADKRPLILFVATDGLTTTYRGLRNSELIRTLTAKNGAGVSVFAFGCGSEVNLFLLDLLTLRNRGESLVRSRIQDSGGALDEFIRGRLDPLVCDLKFRFRGDIDSAEVFPDQLPHLFRGSPLSLYGCCPAGVKATVVRLSGIGHGDEAVELVAKIDFDKAVPGDDTVAREWAARRIFHLLGQMTEKSDPAIRRQLQDLQLRFKIDIPYKLADD